MRIHKLKINPKKCAFGVRVGNFLGFLVHQRGVEVDKNKSQAIMESPLPTNKVQLQRLLGKINFLRRFIANLAGKIQPLTPLLRLKDKENFKWGPPHQKAFDSIKAYLTSPPVLVPPQRGKPLKLYISALEKSIGSLLAQNNEGGKEQAVYYLSRILTEVETRYSPIERLCLALYFTAKRGFSLDVMVLETEMEDWRSPIIYHLKDHSSPTSKKNRQQATKYVLWVENLLRKTPDGLLLKCLGQKESMKVMAKVHEGICGAYHAGTKMRWLLMRYGYFWPDVEKDCKSYARGCEECQRHGSLQHVPSVPLNPVVKPWPIRGWAMDFIGQIYPASSKGHTFVILATDYFTKWVEASAVKTITSAAVKKFIETNILHRFGVPETIVTDCGPSFISKEVEEFANKYKIKMIQSSPYYLQSNGQAEASNKILINIIRRMVTDSPEKWHEKLGNTLWAYRTSKRAGTGTTPYALTFGQDAALPMEINVSSIRIQNQFGLHSEEYIEAMCQGIEDLDIALIEALNEIQEGKRAVARAYNKKVKLKYFKEKDLVWKAVFPLGAQLRGFGNTLWAYRHVKVISLLVKY
ncbi:unnamed protein product [Malus baccata var. baccata]